jgi:WS/DGAT/MGAT family acyltransferase
MEQLNFLDLAMISAERPHAPYHLCMAGIYDPSTSPAGAPGYEGIMAKLESLLPEVPALRRKIVKVPWNLDRPYWVDDPDFDLEFHVRHLALPKPGDWRQYRTQVARLNSRPLDMSRPPWEFTVIDGVDGVEGCPPGCFATVLKIHHCVIDGALGVQLYNVIHDTTADASQPLGERTWTPEPMPSDGELLRRAAVNAVTNPTRALRSVMGNLTAIGREVVDSRRQPTAKNHPVCRIRFNNRVSPHRTWEEARCSLDDLRRVKARVPGATVNDVCISIVGQALDAYLTALGEPPTCPLVTTVPVSTRVPGDSTTSGNQVSMMTVSMHTDITDPLQRVAAIRAETATKKATQHGVTMPVLRDVAQALPGALIGTVVRGLAPLMGRGTPQFNTTVTNVPGPATDQYLMGCKLVRSSGCPPVQDGSGLFHAVSSFAGAFLFAFNADRAAMPDPEVYRAHLDRSIADHVAAAS